MTRKTINITLVLILLVSIIAMIYIWRANSRGVVVSQNSLTGQQQISGEDAPVDTEVIAQSDYRPTLLSDQKIFNLGLRNSEYHTIIRSLDTYTKQTYGEKKHIVYTIDPSSVAYSEESRSFTFRMEVEEASKQFFDVEVKRSEFNVLTIVFRDNGEVVYNQTEKVDLRL